MPPMLPPEPFLGASATAASVVIIMPVPEAASRGAVRKPPHATLNLRIIASSSLPAIAAFDRSCCVCRFIQNSAVVPNTRASRRAVSEVTG